MKAADADGGNSVECTITMKGKKAESAIGMGRHLSMLASRRVHAGGDAKLSSDFATASPSSSPESIASAERVPERCRSPSNARPGLYGPAKNEATALMRFAHKIALAPVNSLNHSNSAADTAKNDSSDMPWPPIRYVFDCGYLRRNSWMPEMLSTSALFTSIAAVPLSMRST